MFATLKLSSWAFEWRWTVLHSIAATAKVATLAMSLIDRIIDRIKAEMESTSLAMPMHGRCPLDAHKFSAHGSVYV
jgi:hypothetical protein